MSGSRTPDNFLSRFHLFGLGKIPKSKTVSLPNLRKELADKVIEQMQPDGLLLSPRERSNSDVSASTPGFHFIEKEDNNNQSREAIRTNSGELIALSEQIGEGNSATVYLGQNQRTGQLVAVKKAKEGQLINKIERDNLAFIKADSPRLYHDDKTILMDLESGVDVWEFSENSRPVPGVKRLQFAIEVVEAVVKLHDKDILHRDINARNVLIDEFYQKASLIDWAMMYQGWACKDTIKGNALYLALEIRKALQTQITTGIEQTVLYSKKTEVYALAMVVAMILQFDFLPTIIDENGEEEITDNVMHFLEDETYIEKNIDTWPKDLQRKYYEQALAYLHQCTSKDPKDRPYARELLTKLKEIQQNYIKEENFSIKTAMLNVEDYLSLSPGFRKLMLLKIYNEYDEAILVDSSGVIKDAREYLKIKSAAENNKGRDVDGQEVPRGILIANTVFVNKDVNRLKADISGYLAARPLPTTVIGFDEVKNKLGIKFPVSGTSDNQTKSLRPRP